LKYSADCTRLKELKLNVCRPLSCGLSIVIGQQSAQALLAIDWPDFLAHFRLRGDQLIVEPLMVTLGMIMTQVTSNGIAQRRFTHQDHPTHRLLFDRAHKPFAVGV
jgi:hypothetical protein